MKKIVSLILAIVLVFGVVAMAGCNSSSATMPNEGEYTRVAISTSSSVESMELSSSVEFVIDDNGLVVSAAPLDENGALILAGDTFEGMTPGEAIEHVIYTAIDLGFLVKSAVEGDQNSVDILVSGTSLYAKELGYRLLNDTKILLGHLDIPGNVEQAKDITVAELREMVRGCGLYTDEEIADMNAAQLLIALAMSRKYAAPFLTDELRDLYMLTKNHKIELAKSQATANIIGGLGDLYASTFSVYTDAVNYYSSVISAIEQFNYDTLISPDSAYQQALTKLQELKAKYVALRANLANLTGEDRAALEAELEMTEQLYNQTQSEVDQIVAQANDTVAMLTGELTKAENKLREVEALLFDYNIEEALQNKIAELDAAANSAKDAFFADFEAKYGEDIKNAIDNLTETKKTIVNAIDKTTADITEKKNELMGQFDEKYGDYIDFISGKIHTGITDEYESIKNSVNGLLDSAKSQLQEKLDELNEWATPDLDTYR